MMLGSSGPGLCQKHSGSGDSLRCVERPRLAATRLGFSTERARQARPPLINAIGAKERPRTVHQINPAMISQLTADGDQT